MTSRALVLTTPTCPSKVHPSCLTVAAVCDAIQGIVALAAYARILQARARNSIIIVVVVIVLQALGFTHESKAFAAAAASNASCKPHETVPTHNHVTPCAGWLRASVDASGNHSKLFLNASDGTWSTKCAVGGGRG